MGELAALAKALDNPARPFVAIVGGSKVSTKLTVLDTLAAKVDTLIVGGGIANTFIAADGHGVGKSLYEADMLELARDLAGDSERQAELFLDEEVRGLRLFIGEANCTQCHNGPLLTNNEFHNTGLINPAGEVPDKGRIVGVREVLEHPFNCKGQHNDAALKNCSELTFARTGPELIGAFRTPSLRNLENTAPYGHKGQLAALPEVLAHYNAAPDALIGHNEAKPLGLGNRELAQLEAFLRTLSAPVEMLQDAT